MGSGGRRVHLVKSTSGGRFVWVSLICSLYKNQVDRASEETLMTTEPESTFELRTIYLYHHQQPSSPSLYFRLLLFTDWHGWCVCCFHLWSHDLESINNSHVISFKWKRANRYRILARLWKIEVFLLYGVLRMVTIRNELICRGGCELLCYFLRRRLFDQWMAKQEDYMVDGAMELNKEGNLKSVISVRSCSG